MLSCLHQVNSVNQMCIQKGDGEADGGKNFSRVYKVRQIWKKRMQNFAVDDIVLLKDDCHQNQWPMARIVGIY